MIAIIDYKMGNLHSVKNALDKLGHECEITSDIDKIRRADKLILPGVGAFPDAARALSDMGLFEEIISLCREGKHLLGICLGMQLLFEESYEFGASAGLGLIPGKVVPIDAGGLKIPHIGWNSLKIHNENDPIIKGMSDGSHVYFVHSFRADTDIENIVCSTEYGEFIPALVKSPTMNVWGAQFHPEKSHDTGLSMIDCFCKL